MKKLLIAMLIACSLGLVACGRADTETPSNNSGTGVTDGTNGNGATGGTNSSQNGMNNQGSSTNETNTSLNNLYTEFKGKVEDGVEDINSEDWDKYSTEFREKLTNLRNTVEDTSMTSTLDDMEDLFNEYDTAIREKTDIDKEKIQEMQKKIEDKLK